MAFCSVILALLISLIALPQRMTSSRVNSIFWKTFARPSQFPPTSSSKESVSHSSSTSRSSFGHFERNELDLVKQKRHNGDIQQLWDDDELNGKMRNALKTTSSNRWTDIRNAKASQERQKIQKAMHAIANNTCVQFRPRNFNEFDYVDIQNRKDEGCYTQVGRMRGRQVLMLESGWSKPCGSGCIQTFPGCVEYPTIIHELMHKIGLWHEHMRYDRDKHIKVHFKNIPPEFHAQFRKIDQYESTTYNVPYDYLSVMHYGKESGARRGGLTTMETIDRRYQDLIGTAKDASQSDYRKICAIYKCSQCMGRPFSPLSANWESASASDENKENGGRDNSNSNKKKPTRKPRLSHTAANAGSDCGDGFLRPSKMFCSLIDATELPNLFKFLCC